MSALKFFLLFLTYEVSIKTVQGNISNTNDNIRSGKGQTDTYVFLDNYIAPTMQIVFYLTDSMKYELKPASGGGGGTTTTMRPTPPHKPGNYAPEIPPGPAVFFAKSPASQTWTSEKDKLADPLGLSGEGIEEVEPFLLESLPEDLDLLGQSPSELLRQINSLADLDTVGDEEDDVLKFSINYEDNVNLNFLRQQKKVPPTRAYVTLLSLYDMLNKEAKEKGLNKYNGYHDRILDELIKTSEGSAESQLKFVLKKVLETKQTRKANIVKKIKQLLEDLEKPDSYLNDALKYIPAMPFTLKSVCA